MGVRNRAIEAFRAVDGDARHWQILALSGLFSISFLTSDFGAKPINLGMAVFGAMTAQLAGAVLTKAAFQWKSALITSLSLSILLRATSPWFWFAAGLIGVGLKFAVRFNGKHIFNPACIGIVAVMLVFGREAWVSPGQWGQAPLLAGYALALAALVLSSAKRLDIALGFLVSFAAIMIGRAMWLGDPLSIPLHNLSSGALLVFAFFMITDPRSTPDSRIGRIIFAMSVAALAAWFVIGPNVRGAPLMALAALAILTPVLDRVFRARRFEWQAQAAAPSEALRAPPPPQAGEDYPSQQETSDDKENRVGVRARPRFLRA
ncbi:MAG: RnfABCDGE type electron transport complex subunit D [Pseudomonadota bacterium]